MFLFLYICQQFTEIERNMITQKIIEFLLKNASQSFNWKQLASKIQDIKLKNKEEFIQILEQLVQKGKIQKKNRGKYQAVSVKNYYEGEISVAKGRISVYCPEIDKSFDLTENEASKALDGDKVEVYVFRRRQAKKQKAEVVRIISRARETFVGIVKNTPSEAFVDVSDPKFYSDILVKQVDLNGAKNNDKVLVKLIDTHKKNFYGVVKKVFGQSGEHQAEIHSILAEYGLPYAFNSEVEEFAQKLDVSISADEIRKRRDMRSVLTFTIDPHDAKDFDDALSFQILKNGNYEIGVHIADVSHYVQPDTILDKEAYSRATSVYLVDRVVPMLPEVLSNFACSLRPNEEKYTFSAVFEMNAKAEILNLWIGRTIIKSDKRFAYEEAQAIIEAFENQTEYQSFTMPSEISIDPQGAYIVPKEMVQAAMVLDSLAKKLRIQRMKLGAISFDKVEVKFHLDDKNNPIGVYTKESKDANKLIEEFMLLANKKVAEFIFKQKKTFVYRIHDEPDMDKLMQMQGVISRFGYRIDVRNKGAISNSINHLLNDVKGKKEQNLIDTLAVRSMSKAAYSTDNIGHYGLAFDSYTHFTSPIRRYPDVMVHRLLQHYLDAGKSADKNFYQERCKHSSQMESLATSAERDSIKYMQIRYMEQHKDENFAGIISGVTEWGIYVEITQNKCEGMVRVRDLKGDYFSFDENQFALVGKRTKKIYQLGDPVRVRVKNTDLIKKYLDFELIE